MALMNNKVGIIIVNFKGNKDTSACLDSLAKLRTKHNVKVYLVDYINNSEDHNLDKHQVKPVIIKTKDNLGFSGMNNLGLRLALTGGCGTFVLLNNDTVVDANFLDPLVKLAHENKVGLVSPKIYFYQGCETHQYPNKFKGNIIWYAGGVIDWKNVMAFHRGVDEVDRNQFDDQSQTDFATGCCLALSKESLDRLGLMDEKYFLYYEDTDWSCKAKKLGMKVLYEPTSVVWHKNAGSTGGSGSTMHRYYQTRNRVFFAMRYAPMKSKIAVLRHSFNKLLKSDDLNEKKAIRDAFFSRWGMR